MAPPRPTATAVTPPLQPVKAMSTAWSSDHWPGPITPTEAATTAIDAQYSQPWLGLKMKKPTFQWATTMATVITPIIPAAASGVRKPAANMTPAPISVAAARRACHVGQRMPMDPNQPAVPFRPPPPKTLL